MYILADRKQFPFFFSIFGSETSDPVSSQDLGQEGYHGRQASQGGGDGGGAVPFGALERLSTRWQDRKGFGKKSMVSPLKSVDFHSCWWNPDVGWLNHHVLQGKEGQRVAGGFFVTWRKSFGAWSNDHWDSGLNNWVEENWRQPNGWPRG